MMEKEAVELEERKNSSQDALHKTREVLKLEGEKWEVERGALNQVRQINAWQGIDYQGVYYVHLIRECTSITYFVLFFSSGHS